VSTVISSKPLDAIAKALNAKDRVVLSRRILALRIKHARHALLGRTDEPEWLDLAVFLSALCRDGGVKDLELLLQSGAPADGSRAAETYSPLFMAITNNSVEAVRLLLKHGADVSLPNSNGLTPVDFAIISGRADILRVLLDGGASPNLPSNEKKTPLMRAAGAGSLPAVTLLLEKGADPLAKDSAGNTAKDYVDTGAASRPLLAALRKAASRKA
jgi:ankyrin repeat protein